ncbi:arsenate reductase/protein-tyrosine-phosphatase family protein [Candidatus Solirubrobacter pratensis]|uniref:arsenate reductase/protein-tyrosine-phosphatase family protein n=1 Tax=Candidatus Solirubrobacter pratensis TaxID=1298857 RepID=UPI0003FA7190|nr:MarR family transcriptional regulator [Candidatus Solirubrobacter pratensis]
MRLAGHPLRWRLLSELGRSDRQVRELCALVGRPQSLVSYHLGRLRSERLVSMRRSSADRRDAYYSLDLPRCGELLAAGGGDLHPGLRPALASSSRREQRTSEARPRLLFLCTGNSARSQMAEALVQHLAGGAIEVFSAGSHPKPLHRNAVRAMRARDVDIAGRGSKHLDELAQQRFDHVVTLCDRVREVCPEFPGRGERIHWSVPTPRARATRTAQTYPAFERTATELVDAAAHRRWRLRAVERPLRVLAWTGRPRAFRGRPFS